MHTLADIPRLLSRQQAAENPQAMCRLFHGRGHAWPGLAHVSVDWLPPVAWITLYKPESAEPLAALADHLLDALPNCRSVQVQYRYERLGPAQVLRGEPITELVCEEQGLKYQLTLGKNRNTGLFLDMAVGRRWVQNNSREKKVLNLFAYTCGFSVAALAGGANRVMNVDIVPGPLKVGVENHLLNHLPLEAASFDKLNIFKSFGRLKKRGPWDLLICDPPTRQKGSVDIGRDYAKILRHLPELMTPDGELLLCLNDPMRGSDWLQRELSEHAPQYTRSTPLPLPEVFHDAEGKGLTILHCHRN